MPTTTIASGAGGKRDFKKARCVFNQALVVRYAFIDEHRQQFSVAAMCRVLQISCSGYYGARHRPPSLRSTTDLALRAEIKRVHAEHRFVAGSVKTWRLLQNQGIVCGKHRVARLRKLDGIESIRRQRFRVMQTHQHTEPAAPDLVQRKFTVAAPNTTWASDITSIRTREGWLHLAIVLDLFARRVVGWAIDTSQSAALPIAALRMAIAQRQPAAKLICHTDQGSVYGSVAYRAVLQEHQLIPSMSRRGNCHDNAVAESFFSQLKNEITHHTIYATREQAKAAIADYIEVYYNRHRLHQSLQYQTPADFEVKYANIKNPSQSEGLTLH